MYRNKSLPSIDDFWSILKIIHWAFVFTWVCGGSRCRTEVTWHFRQALEKNKHTQKCESGSFRPIFGVGHFGLGRWVVSAHFRGESFWPWVVSAKVYTDKQGTGGRAFGLVTVFSHKFLHLKLSNKSI